MCLAIPGEIIELIETSPLLRTGRVRLGGITREINLACVPEAGIGDYVVVHAGVAISALDPTEAERVFETLQEYQLNPQDYAP